MVKHRFILRSWKEAEIFAAVPTEHEVLTWKRWERPVAVERILAAIDTHLVDIKDVVDDASMLRTRIIGKYDSELDDLEVHHKAQSRDHEQAIRNLEKRARAARATDDIHERIAKARKDHADDQEEWRVKIEVARGAIEAKVDEMMGTLVPRWEKIQEAFAEHREELAPIRAEAVHLGHTGSTDAASFNRLLAALHATSLKCVQAVNVIAGEKRDAFEPTFRLFEGGGWFKDLSSRNQPDPTDVLTCPEGVPFSYYTVEIPVPGGVRGERIEVVVIEGVACWDSVRISTEVPGPAAHFVAEKMHALTAWGNDTVKMAAELVTQMLTERQRNPTAETRVLVNEVNSAKAHETRREEAKPGAEPRLRSIKFDLAPPRYLREAAARIIASKVRAHWVMGHWRNQPHGQGRSLRRQIWIAPHVRGLGEAGATMSRVAAPKARG